MQIKGKYSLAENLVDVKRQNLKLGRINFYVKVKSVSIFQILQSHIYLEDIYSPQVPWVLISAVAGRI